MELRYFQYRIPFVHPFRTSQNTLGAREGILLEYQRGDLVAYGEAAPLPGFSHESLNQVKDQLEKHSAEITDLLRKGIIPDELDDFYESNGIVPSLCFALDTLACNYKAGEMGVPVSRLLFDNLPEPIPVNAVISMQSASDALRLAEQYTEEGYRTLKFKIGNNFTEELSLLKSIRHRFPGVSLRIDANRSWSVDEAHKNLSKLEKLAIEYCEEPLDQPSFHTLEQLSASSPVPIALDETLTHPDIVQSVASFIPVLVLKPMVIGQISKLFATKRLADTHDNKVIYTTALESGVGRKMTAILASGLGTRQSAHGLATGSYLKLDVWHDGTYINNGNFSLPDHSGQNKKYRPNLQNIAEEIHF